MKTKDDLNGLHLFHYGNTRGGGPKTKEKNPLEAHRHSRGRNNLK